MCVCSRCGSLIDAGEPYCQDCGYICGNDDDNERETIRINFDDYILEEVVEALRVNGYDLSDLEDDLIDEDELEDILFKLDKV